MWWWPSTGCGSSWRRTCSTVRSCAVFEHRCCRKIFCATDHFFCACRWIFWVQNCSLELHCFSYKWVYCLPCFSLIQIVNSVVKNSAEASCLLPSSLWRRGVAEDLGAGANGLFQLWLESVSKYLDSVSNDEAFLTRAPILPHVQVWLFCDSLCLHGSDRSCLQYGALLFYRGPATASAAPVNSFCRWHDCGILPLIFYVGKMQIYFAGCLRLSRGIVTCWTRCLSFFPGWQASVWPSSSSTTPLPLWGWSSLLMLFSPTAASESFICINAHHHTPACWSSWCLFHFICPLSAPALWQSPTNNSTKLLGTKLCWKKGIITSITSTTFLAALVRIHFFKSNILSFSFTASPQAHSLFLWE